MHWIIAILLFLLLGDPTRADGFDHYTNPILARLTQAEANIRETKALTMEAISETDTVLKGITAAFVVVRTQEGRLAKLLINTARQKLDSEGNFLPTLRVDRYTCFRQGEEQAIQAGGKDLTLFPGYRLSLDLGQIVPEEVGGDLRFVVTGNRMQLVPLGKARLYLVTRALPDIEPKKQAGPIVGEKFETSYYDGTYKLYDDGRRSGKLSLNVDGEGNITGSFLSDKDGSRYDVRGRVGMPKHSCQFTITFPRSEQQFTGWLFTGDANILTGSSRLIDREAGFYAVRVTD